MVENTKLKTVRGKKRLSCHWSKAVELSYKAEKEKSTRGENRKGRPWPWESNKRREFPKRSIEELKGTKAGTSATRQWKLLNSGKNRDRRAEGSSGLQGRIYPRKEERSSRKNQALPEVEEGESAGPGTKLKAGSEEVHDQGNLTTVKKATYQ